jgi:hypothetical protein
LWKGAATISLLVLMVSGLLGGCRAVPRFCKQSAIVQAAGSSKHVISFDTDKDGQPDYWQRFDDNGRIVELRFSRQNGEPNEVVLLDKLVSQGLPHFIIALDGVPYGVVEELCRRGKFRLFYPPSRVVTCFPGMTNPAFWQVFGGEQPIAYESKYFDRQQNRLVGGNDAYLSGEAADWAKKLDYRCSFKLDALAYMKPDMVFGHELKEITDVFRLPTTGTKIAYCVATAGLGTRGGREAIAKYLETIDGLCEQIVYERRGRVKISLLADHGHSASGQGRVSFGKLLEENGYRLTNHLGKTGDVVAVEYGLVHYAAFYTDDPAGVAAALLTDPVIELACYPVSEERTTAEGLDVVVQSLNGKAVIRKIHGRYRYLAEYGDPLGLLGIISQLRQKGKVGTDGFIDDKALLMATLNHIYPDPLRRIWMAFNGLVRKPADLIVCLKDGWVHGSGFFYAAIGKVASTHGSLNQSDSMTFALTMLGGLPPVLRLEEVMPALVSFRRD